MKPVDGWQKILRKAWSVRLNWIAALLSAIEVGLQFFAPDKASGMFAVLAFFVSLGANAARIVAQPKLWQ